MAPRRGAAPAAARARRRAGPGAAAAGALLLAAAAALLAPAAAAAAAAASAPAGPGAANASGLEAALLREAYSPDFQEWLVGHRRCGGRGLGARGVPRRAGGGSGRAGAILNSKKF
jgi:hypothetical protein